MKTINEIVPSEIDMANVNYDFNTELTSKLDSLDSDFNQDLINEIVLWKVNRYAPVDNYTLELINKIKKSDKVIDHALTGEILLKLLNKDQKGIRLAMASAILRFKNPKIYQIIDQRVYRFIYGKELKYSMTNLNEQIVLYLDYLNRLRFLCTKHNVRFEQADRIFYTLDKLYNFNTHLKGY